MWGGRDAWLVTRMADVRAVLANPHFSNNPAHPGYPFLSPARAETLKNYQTFITMDAPDHTRLRRMLTKDFTQKLFQRLPGLALAVSFEDISFKNEMYIYGLRTLPVTW